MNKLSELRAKKGMTQKDLSKASGIPLPTIKYLEKANSDFNRCRCDTLEKLCGALKISIKNFLK